MEVCLSAALAELVPPAGSETRLFEVRRQYAGPSLASPGRRNEGERVSGKRSFGYFGALAKVTRGALPGQRIKGNNHIRRLWKWKNSNKKIKYSGTRGLKRYNGNGAKRSPHASGTYVTNS